MTANSLNSEAIEKSLGHPMPRLQELKVINANAARAGKTSFVLFIVDTKFVQKYKFQRITVVTRYVVSVSDISL